MKVSRYYYILVVLLFTLDACKKDSPVEIVKPEPQAVRNTKDSIAFTVNNINYTFTDTYSVGMGNSQIDLKPYDQLIPGRQSANQTAGKYWYGQPDSTMYSSFFKLLSEETNRSTIEIIFNKKFKTADLFYPQIGFGLIPKDQTGIFKIGKMPFAIDYQKENTKEGVILKLSTEEGTFSSTVPGFSIAVQSHRTDIQDNSTFQITNVEKLVGDTYLIEATFSLNVFDKDEKASRVEKGYMRKKINMVNNMASFFLN